MEPLKQNNFEEEWQRAFENASISPSDALWDKIERELDRKERRPFLFFLRPSAVTMGLAAALVMALGGLLFFNKNTKKNQYEIAQNAVKPKQNSEQISTQNVPKIDDFNIEIIVQPQDFSNKELPTLAGNSRETLEKNFLENKKSNKAKNQNLNEIPENIPQSILAKTEKNSSRNIVQNIENQTILIDKNISENNNILVQNTESQVIISKNESNLVNNSRNIFAETSLLESKKYTYFGSRYTLNRNKLVFDTEPTETKIIASNDSKFWLGIQSGVSPFDPKMSLGGLNVVALQDANSFAKASNVQSPSSPNSPNIVASDMQGNVAVSQPQNAIKSGVGINMGVAYGYKISKKWSLESGIRYLRGNSTLQSNTYSFQQNGIANTFLANYLVQNSSRSAAYTTNNSTNTVVADASKFGNLYKYLMIPMQLGYEIGLSKKLGLNLLAGISTDFFLQNTIVNDNSILQEKNTIDGSSKIYKPLNISGLGGIRVSYLLNKHWQANIGTSYQKALFSGINSSTALQMRLQMFGINYGVNYRF